MASRELPGFQHGTTGMTRFPPNIEQLTVGGSGKWIWLTARRNETELRFLLTPDDVRHLCDLLQAAAGDPAAGDPGAGHDPAAGD